MSERLSVTTEDLRDLFAEVMAELRDHRITVDQQHAEIAELRAEIGALRRSRALPGATSPGIDDELGNDEQADNAVTSRRRFFAVAGGAAAAAAAAATVSSASPAAANLGNPVTIGTAVAYTTNVTPTETTLDYFAASGTPSSSRSLFQVLDASDYTASHPACVTGQASRVGTGVFGSTLHDGGNGVVGRAKAGTGSSTYGVWGLGETGPGVVGESKSGVDVWMRGTGRLKFKNFTASGPPVSPTNSFSSGEIVGDATGNFFACVAGGSPGTWKKFQFVEDLVFPSNPPMTTGPLTGSGAPVGVTAKGGAAALKLLPAAGTAPAGRSDAHALGEIDIDSAGDVWLCVAAGTPGTWRKLGGPATAGAFHALDPFRAFDSRWSGTSLHGGESTIVSVADAHDLDGAVTVAGRVPAGASAVAFNLTVTQTVNSGYLSVAPGTTTVVGASSINWASSGLDLANGLIVGVDASRQLKVFAGGGGSTHFIIDVAGYYL